MVSDRLSWEKLYRESLSTVIVMVVSGVNLLVNSQVIFLGPTVGLSRFTVKERVIVIPVMVVAKFPSRAVTIGTAERQNKMYTELTTNPNLRNNIVLLTQNIQ